MGKKGYGRIIMLAVLGLWPAASVLGSTVRLIGPTNLTVDGDSATHEQFTFEIVVDACASDRVVAFEWQLGVTGTGLGFDIAASQSSTQLMALDAVHAPPYVFLGDSGDFLAAASAKGIRAGDLTPQLAGCNPTGKSLGLVVLTVVDDLQALGTHTLEDPAGFFLLDDVETKEALTIASLEFAVAPEPASLALLAAGGAALLARRRDKQG